MPSMHGLIRVVKGSGKENFGGLRGPAHPRPASPPGDLPIGRDELESPTCFHHLPPTLMHETVVVVAERQKVPQVIQTPSTPELEVMRIRVVDRPVAARPAACAVPCLEGSPLRRRDRSRRSADIDDD